MVNCELIPIFASKIKKKMWKVILFSLIIVAFSVIFMAVQIILKKHGRFPKTHVSSSKAMRKRGITCVQSQDRMARTENTHAIKEIKTN